MDQFQDDQVAVLRDPDPPPGVAVALLSLRLTHPAGAQHARVTDPAPSFRICGNRLLAGPKGVEVARYRDGLWHAGGGSFLVLTAAVPTTIVFQNEDASQSDRYGPYETVLVAAGAIRSGPAPGKLLAIFDDPAHCWQVTPERKAYTSAVIEPS
jgi:hypothetical protein